MNLITNISGKLSKGNRKIDALVDEHVMGQCLAFPYEGSDDQASAWYDYIPHYSTDMAAAWEIVDKLKAIYTFDIDNYSNRDGKWYVEIQGDEDAHGCAHVMAGTAAMAICLAALKLKGIGYE